MATRRGVASPIGRRDRFVTLVAQVQTTGGSGMPITTDGTAYPMYALKDDVTGQELMRANQLTAPFTTRWEVHYRAEIDPERVDVPKNFVLDYEGRRYDIQAAAMIGRRVAVELTTLARQG